MTKIFIDGSSGTTGLRIHERLEERKDIELIILPDDKRKEASYIKEAINKCDIAFLCLPDDAAKEAVSMIENPDTAVIDTSTAHRTAQDWTYGFPELIGYDNIRNSKRIANPGCHASGFVALITPLIREGALKKETLLSCFSITGYSGGGKKMIADYESDNKDQLLEAPRQYGLTQQHKHLKEMLHVSGIENLPAFCPIVSNYYSGMEVTVPVFGQDLNVGIDDLKEIYKKYYSGKIVHFDEKPDENGFMSANAFSGRDDMQICISGNKDRLLLISRFDNLGKGASGAAIQNMNILLGTEETKGLQL